MSTKSLLPLLCAGMIGFAEAAVVVKPVPYEIDGEAFEGLLIYDDTVTTPRPGLLMVPNWLGVTDDSAKKAAASRPLLRWSRQPASIVCWVRLR